jgi:hypothetical protein
VPVESIDREPVFVARSASDEARVEAVLREEGVEYTAALEAAEDADPGAVCFLAIVYKVPAAAAERARALLRQRGLAAGVVSG